MAERLSMAGEGNSAPEAEAAKPVVVTTKSQRGFLEKLLNRGPKMQVLVKPDEQKTSFSDKERLQRASELLETQLTPEKGKAIIEAHKIGVGEEGKNNGQAGIYNYTREQLRKKTEILKQAGFSKDQIRALMESGIAGVDTLPDWLKPAAVETSSFQTAFETSQDYALIDPTKLPPFDPATGINRQAEFQQLSADNRLELNRVVLGAVNGSVLLFVRNRIKEVYEKVTGPSSQPSPQRTMDDESVSEASPGSGFRSKEDRLKYIHEALGNYEEDFWSYGDATLREVFGTADIIALRREFKGVASYVATRVEAAVNKELNGIPLKPLDFGDAYLLRIKREIEAERSQNAEERERQRQRSRRNAPASEILPYSTWRERFDFTWAENREELEVSVFAWIEKFVAHLPEATIEELHNESNTWKHNAINALEKAANRIGLLEKEPFYKELKSTIEAYVGVLGGVKFLETDGGFEAYTTYLEEFGHNFNEKHDAIMLGNAKSAIIQAFLARNHGEIALGTPEHNIDTEKPKSGDLNPFRANLELAALEYAKTHELYIKESDFKTAEEASAADRLRVDNEVRLLNLTPQESRMEINKRIAEVNRRYGWDDEIEEMLLDDSRGMTQAESISLDPNNPDRQRAVARVEARRGVFREIKARLYKEEKERFDVLTEDQRRDVIRGKIKEKIRLAGKEQLISEINAMPPAEADRALWNYVRDLNRKMESQGHTPWFPSKWDTVRLSINKQTKLIDRALSEDQLDAMIENVGAFRTTIEIPGLPEQEIELNIDSLTPEQIEQAVRGLNLEDPALPNFISFGKDLTPEQVKKAKAEVLEDALFNLKSRGSEADRALNINRNYQKFLGLDARWGGIVARDVIGDGRTELTTISSRAEEILKDKIDLEESQIEEQVEIHKQALIAAGTLSDEEIDEAVLWKRRLLRRDATFGATLALRELGVAHDLPIWNYDFFNDPKLVGTIAPYLGYRHGDKPKIADLLDQARREMRTVHDSLAKKYMDGTILVVRNEANLELDAAGQPEPHHEESWDRKRVINDAGEMALRDIFESRFMISTSGGVEITNLISKIADLGIYDLLWEMGCKDFREFQGFIKRRDESELAQQSLWNTKKWKDPISYAKRLREAGAARLYLTGGQTKEGYVQGVLVEPLSGAYRYRDEFFKADSWHGATMRREMSAWTEDGTWKAKMQAYLESDENFNLLTEQQKDRLTELGASIMKPLIDYLDHRRYVMNRGGRSPTNWKLDNELIIKAYIGEMSDESIYGSYHLDYAAPGRSKLAKKIFMAILRTSSYHLLSEKEYDDLGLDKIEVSGVSNKRPKHRIDRKIKVAENKIIAKRQEIEARPLPIDIQRKMAARRLELERLGTHLATNPLYPGQPNLDLEVDRIKDEYIELQLHKEVTGEWPASFAPLDPT